MQTGGLLDRKMRGLLGSVTRPWHKMPLNVKKLQHFHGSLKKKDQILSEEISFVLSFSISAQKRHHAENRLKSKISLISYETLKKSFEKRYKIPLRNPSRNLKKILAIPSIPKFFEALALKSPPISGHLFSKKPKYTKQGIKNNGLL